jgi:ABC-type molybdate transport system substrate-binding protein
MTMQRILWATTLLAGAMAAPGLAQNAGNHEGATPAAERFFAYVQAPPARAVLRRYGFAVPGETG